MKKMIISKQVLRSMISEILAKKIKVSKTRSLSNRLNETKMMAAAEKELRRQNKAVNGYNPTPQEIQTLAKEYEQALLLATLTKKEAYASAHDTTVADSELIAEAQVFGQFFKDFQRPGAGSSSIANPISAGLVPDTTVQGIKGYSFKKPNNIATFSAVTTNPSPADIAESNFMRIHSAGKTPPTDADSFARVAFNAMHLSSGNVNLILPTNTGEKLELALAATLAYLDPSTIYKSLLANQPGKDIVRAKDFITFESKFTEDKSGDINDNFGASQPTSLNLTKYFVFLSEDRSYFVHCPKVASIGVVGLESIASDTTATEYERANNLIYTFLSKLQNLKSAFAGVLADISSRQFLYLPEKKDGKVINDVRLANASAFDDFEDRVNDRKQNGDLTRRAITARDRYIALNSPNRLQAGNDNPNNHTMNLLVNRSYYVVRDIHQLHNLLIDAINSSQDKEDLIAGFKHIIVTTSAKDFKAQSSSGTSNIGGQVNTVAQAEASFEDNWLTSSGDLRQFEAGAPDEEEKNSMITRLLSGGGSGLNVPPAAAGIKLNAEVRKCFNEIIGGLIYVWNLKDSPELKVKIGQLGINTAFVGGQQASYRRVAASKAGTSFYEIIIDPSTMPASKINLIANALNMSVFSESVKRKMVEDYFTGNEGPSKQIPGWKLQTQVIHKIQQDDKAKTELLIESFVEVKMV